jgi:hypothetical protein
MYAILLDFRPSTTPKTHPPTGKMLIDVRCYEWHASGYTLYDADEGFAV